MDEEKIFEEEKTEEEEFEEEEKTEEEEFEENNIEEENIDYSSLLSEINDNISVLNSNLEYIQTQNDTIIQAQGALMKNTYFIVYFMFAFFIFGALVLVIKFFKQFF